MSHSEIFDEFLEVALESGLITKAELEEETKTTKKKDSSLYEMLYGVSEKSGRDLIEEAHPETVVVMRSHDKLNGIFENIQERSDIMNGLVTQFPTGNLFGQIYAKAHKELLNEVIKTAFLLDRENEEELMVLADDCGDKIQKIGAWPIIAWVGIAAGGALLTYLGVTGKYPMAQGMRADTEKAIEEIKDVISNYPKAGVTLSPLVTRLRSLQLNLEIYGNYESQLAQTLMEVHGSVKPEEKKKAIAAAALSYIKEGKSERIEKSCEEILDISKSILQMINVANRELGNLEEKNNKGEDSSAWYGLTKIKELFVDSETTDAIKALEVLSGTISTFGTKVRGVLNSLNELKTILTQGESETPEESLPTAKVEENPAKKDNKSKSRAEHYADYIANGSREKMTFDQYLKSLSV